MAEDSIVTLPRPGSSITDDPLLAVLREGATRMLTQAIETEVEAFLAAQAGLCDQQGRRRLVRNGHGTRARDSDRDWPGQGAPAEGARPWRRRGR